MIDQSQRLVTAQKHLAKAVISKENKKSIEQFIQQISAESISKIRQVKYIYSLVTISKKLNKDLNYVTKNDIVKLCSDINNSEYSDWTKHDFLVIIKRFYKWLRKTDDYPPEVKWIRPTMKRSKRRMPKQLLSINDVKKLTNHANNLRDRCIILFLYESGVRVGELLGIRIKDIRFDKLGAKIDLFGKTGSRNIRIVSSTPSISNWLLEHPAKDNNGSFLFCGLWGKNRGEELKYRHLNRLLKEAATRAGIKKPVNPHHFRHSRITEVAKRFTESQLCAYFGWVHGSQEAATYVHLSGRDIENAVLALHGLAEEEKKEDQFKTITCPRCTTINDPSSRFCSHCSLGLDVKSVMDYDKQREESLKIGITLKDLLNDSNFHDYIGNVVLNKLKKVQKKE